MFQPTQEVYLARLRPTMSESLKTNLNAYGRVISINSSNYIRKVLLQFNGDIEARFEIEESCLEPVRSPF